MGCDIHGIIEVRHNDEWLMHSHLKDDSRNYSRFAQLAGVRSNLEQNPRQPEGIPKSACQSTRYHSNQWGGDGHSHSWLDLKEASVVFLITDYNPTIYAQKYPESHYFGIDHEAEGKSLDDYRLVFWFDN